MTVTALPLHEPATGPGTSRPAPPSPTRTACRTAPARRACPGSATTTWDLSPLARREHEPARRINWDLFPVALRGSFKRAGWALVNLPTPEALLERAATCRARASRHRHHRRIAEHWRRYAAWLAGRGITRLAEVDAACHERVGRARRTASRPRTAPAAQALNAVSMLWGFAPHLPAADRIPMPPWEAEGLRHYLPADEGRNENATAPIHPAVMSPLLTWALRFTEDFAADILAALAEQQRLRSRIAARHNPDAARPAGRAAR